MGFEMTNGRQTADGKRERIHRARAEQSVRTNLELRE